MNTKANKVIRSFIVGLFALLLVWIVYWLSTQSRITIVLPSQTNSGVVTISNGEDTIEATLDSTQTTIRVPKDTYSVVVRAGDESYFSVTETKSFLANVDVLANLQSQKQRTFVGDDPGSCLEFFDNTLVSFGCNGQLYDLKLHTPSTNTVPTYTKSVRSVLSSAPREVDQVLLESIGDIEGVIEEDGVLYVLAKQPFIEGKEILSHILYSITPSSNSFDFKFIERLRILDPESSYKMAGSVDNLYIYNTNDLTELYTGTINDIQRFEISGSPDTTLYEPFVVVENNNSFILSYREIPETVEDYSNGSLKSIIYTDGNEISLGSYITNIQACGSGYCTLNNDRLLTVYDATFTELLSIPGVESFKSEGSSEKIFLTINNNVVNFSLATKEGYSLFDFTGYEFVSYGSSDADFPVLTLRSPYKEHVLIMQDSNLTNQIEDVVTELVDESIINTLSLNRNNLFISPELGELDYYGETDSLDYNPVVKTAVGNRINQKLDNINTYDLNITINNITN